MKPADFLTTIVTPALEQLHALGGPPVTTEAQRFIVAIAMQESGPQLNARYQGSPAASPGPARGWWQFEQGGGVTGVLNHATTKPLAAKICDHCAVVAQPAAAWRSLEGHDDLATMFARLLIMTEPRALPKSAAEGWSQYLNLWRPGKPHENTWAGNWQTADETCRPSDKASTTS